MIFGIDLRACLRWMAFSAFGLVAATGFVSAPAVAQDIYDNARYAAIVVDAQTGEVLYARHADSARYPASLTKIMTLYMAFEALSTGELKPDDYVTMSHHANMQSPVKIGFNDGDMISIDAALRLTALYSANDLAVGLAEKIGGSEERFAAMMTIRAQELGMNQTHFVNASGLPDARQTASARDLAILARAVMRDYPQYYSYFNVKSYEFRGRTYVNHNPLAAISGVDGMKTGYTGAAGYNLVTSQLKNGHRLIAVMMGGNNKQQRRDHVSQLMDTGFDVIKRRSVGEQIAVAQAQFVQGFSRNNSLFSQPRPYTLLAQASPEIGSARDTQLRATLGSSEQANGNVDIMRLSAKTKAPNVVRALSATKNHTDTSLASATETDDALAPPLRASKSAKPTAKPETKRELKARLLAEAKASKKKQKDPDAIWGVQVGSFKQKSLASEWLKDLRVRFRTQLADTETQIVKSGEGWFRSRFVEMTQKEAKAACRAIDAKRLDCMIIKL